MDFNVVHHALRKLNVLQIASIILIVGFLSSASAEPSTYDAISCRKYTVLLTDFGAKGDGKTLNTKAFQAAVANLSTYSKLGGGLLVVPGGRWLTGSFNLTSNFTLYLKRKATILASQDLKDWPVVAPLPSYGHGRDNPNGNRYASLLFGVNLTDVVVTGRCFHFMLENLQMVSETPNNASLALSFTGDNGTIDGQGQPWWDMYRKKELTQTRPYLYELMYSHNIQISNLVLVNSPSWNIHPVYSSNVIVQGITIIAPVNSPNTDGINPDSCTNVRIKNCHIISGDDCIALKSGFDQYGIQFAKPLTKVSISNIFCISPSSAVIALGSEMSGGISDVRAVNISAYESESAVRIKTALGRGGYVKNINVQGMCLKTMKYVFWMSAAYKEHAPGYNPAALPVIKNITFNHVNAENVTIPGWLDGIKDHPFTDICISNVNMTLSVKPKKPLWNCSDISGKYSNVDPPPCEELIKTDLPNGCPFPTMNLPIETFPFQTCSLNHAVKHVA